MGLATGSKLGPYEIQAAIGAGGMGEVYRARDTRLNRSVALKVLPESFAQDSDRLRRFEQEAKAVAALNHPNILAIYDIGEQQGVPYLVSELLEGNSLRAEMDNGSLSPRKTADYAVQMAEGLSAAHDKHITHRDLKPENVFVTREGRLKILDFGLAKQADHVNGGISESAAVTITATPTEVGTVVGTVGYMAPEQVRGGLVDGRTDIFAFGSVLYEMVSGRRAFRRDTAAETMTAILKEDPPEFSEIEMTPVSPGMERIVRRCLEKKPEQRFQSAKDLAFALEEMSGTSSKSVATAVVAQPSKISSWMITAAAIPLALAAGAVLGWYLRPRPTDTPVFKQVSFHRGEVVHARFAPDGKTIVYAGKLNGGAVDTYVVREDYPEPVSAGLNGAVLLAISRQGQMAVLTNPQYFAHRAWIGTLATSPIGGSAPREVLERVADADWSPDNAHMAIIKIGEIGEWRLEYPIGKVLVDGENWLSDVRVSPDGKQLAFFRHPPNNDDRGDVMLSDEQGKLRVLSSGWESLEGLAWSPGGKEVWFSASGAGELYCLHAVTLIGKDRLAHCGAAPTIIEDFAASGRALVSAGSHQVTMAMLEHGSDKEQDISWLDSSYLPRLSSDGSSVLFTDQSGQAGGEYSVYLRKRGSSAAVRIGGGGFANDISPDGRWALVALRSQDKARLQIVPTGAGEAKEVNWDDYKPIFTTWYPDGKHILMRASKVGEPKEKLYITDSSGSVPKLVDGFEEDGNLAAVQGWSMISFKAGKKVVLFSPEMGSRTMPENLKAPLPIAWTTDPNKVFTEEILARGANIYKLDLNSGREELWQAIQPSDQIGLRPMTDPVAITPDGRWMAYRSQTQTAQLYVSDSLK